MFGYLDIDKTKLSDGQRGLWQTFMCGLCFSTKKLFGNFPRMFVNNDVNFFNVLFHSVLNLDVEPEYTHCISHPVKKRTVIKTTELTDRLSAGNVILTYFNLYDDVVDGCGIKKKTALSMYKKAYKKAKKQWAELDEVVRTRYEELRSLEKSGCAEIDRVAHSFACLSQDFCRLTLGEKSNEFCETLCYNLGKWIYLADAVDDAAKDLKRGDYNPLTSCYGAKTVEQLATHKEEISFLMYAVLNRIAQCYNDMNLTKYTCILQNVLFDGIRGKTETILAKLN